VCQLPHTMPGFRVVGGDFAGGSEGPGVVSAVRFRTVAYTGPGRRRFRGFGTSGTADVRDGFPVPVVPLCWWVVPGAAAGGSVVRLVPPVPPALPAPSAPVATDIPGRSQGTHRADGADVATRGTPWAGSARTRGSQ